MSRSLGPCCQQSITLTLLICQLTRGAEGASELRSYTRRLLITLFRILGTFESQRQKLIFLFWFFFLPFLLFKGYSDESKVNFHFNLSHWKVIWVQKMHFLLFQITRMCDEINLKNANKSIISPWVQKYIWKPIEKVKKTLQTSTSIDFRPSNSLRAKW